MTVHPKEAKDPRELLADHVEAAVRGSIRLCEILEFAGVPDVILEEAADLNVELAQVRRAVREQFGEVLKHDKDGDIVCPVEGRAFVSEQAYRVHKARSHPEAS